jgi:hypothetical protein
MTKDFVPAGMKFTLHLGKIKQDKNGPYKTREEAEAALAKRNEALSKAKDVEGRTTKEENDKLLAKKAMESARKQIAAEANPGKNFLMGKAHDSVAIRAKEAADAWNGQNAQAHKVEVKE